MESVEADLMSHFSPNTTSVIRKLRKKLRQIEKLERLERELTEEEEIKVMYFLLHFHLIITLIIQ